MVVICLVLLYASRVQVLKPISSCHYPNAGLCGSKDYSIILSRSGVLRDDSASDLSNMASPCCFDFYVGLW